MNYNKRFERPAPKPAPVPSNSEPDLVTLYRDIMRHLALISQETGETYRKENERLYVQLRRLI